MLYARRNVPRQINVSCMQRTRAKKRCSLSLSRTWDRCLLAMGQHSSHSRCTRAHKAQARYSRYPIYISFRPRGGHFPLRLNCRNYYNLLSPCSLARTASLAYLRSHLPRSLPPPPALSSNVFSYLASCKIRSPFFHFAGSPRRRRPKVLGDDASVLRPRFDAEFRERVRAIPQFRAAFGKIFLISERSAGPVPEAIMKVLIKKCACTLRFIATIGRRERE